MNIDLFNGEINKTKNPLKFKNFSSIYIKDEKREEMMFDTFALRNQRE